MGTGRVASWGNAPMVDALRANMAVPARVSAPDVSARLRSGELTPQDIPYRESLIWAQQQPIVPVAPTAIQSASVGSVNTVSTPELAAMAADVYNDVAVPPPGYRVATQADLTTLGLKPTDLVSPRSSFRAYIYVKGANENAQYVVAFRGTTSSSDWQANLRQGVGLASDHYQRALKIGSVLARHPHLNVTATGHSSGGGLASVVSLASGFRGVTFNAAGLSDATIAAANRIRTDASIGRAVEVQAFYVRGEVLSAIQDGGDRVIGALFGGVTGAAVADAPSAYGTRIPLTAIRPTGTPWYGDNPVARHGMDWVRSSLGGG